MRVGLDVDDVVRNFVPGLLKFYKHTHLHDVVPGDVKDFDLLKTLTQCKTREQLTAMMAHYMAHPWANVIMPVPHAPEGVRELRQRGHDVYFITAGTHPMNTYEWFERHRLPLDNIYFSSEKGRMAQLLKLDMFVDDCVANLDDIVRVNGPKVMTIVYDQPWNRIDRREGVAYAHHRATNWKSILSMVDQENIERLDKR
jgi:uncharacterized HAD superfamily protein